MESKGIYYDIAKRTDGDIYIGVVGPVRTGKSTFIKRFMETLVVPNIENPARRERATDELPQSSAGKTIMTTEPKFIPEEAVTVSLDHNATMNVRMIDCVGFIVPSSIGYIENENPRMVHTPWFEEEIPFNMAAEIGTQKVIEDHSTIGIVVTTDGSISDIPREEYEEAESRAISELEKIGKPFIVLLNCMDPYCEASLALRDRLAEKYNHPVVAMNCLDLDENNIKDILAQLLYEFPVKEIRIDIPKWVTSLSSDHWLKSAVYDSIKEGVWDIGCMNEVTGAAGVVSGCEYIKDTRITGIDLGVGSVKICIDIVHDLFYKILGEVTGLEIENESQILPCMENLAKIKKEFEKFQSAIAEVEATGYGIVMPSIDELTLEEPEIVKQGGRYGVKLKASAPSIHMMRADITTEVSPIVGSEKQSEELVMYLMQEFEESPGKIWESNIFGKSLHDLVNEGLHNKLYRMPADARLKLQETIERIINEGCGGLICIIL